MMRPAAAVLADVLDGKISVPYARSGFGVVVRDGIVDEQATARLRAEHEGAPA
jgi:N-methylhydantoinase B